LQLLRDARLRDPNNLDTRYFLGAVLASSGRARPKPAPNWSQPCRAAASSAAPPTRRTLLGTLK
jgi:hypothetical protein